LSMDDISSSKKRFWGKKKKKKKESSVSFETRQKGKERKQHPATRFRKDGASVKKGAAGGKATKRIVEAERSGEKEGGSSLNPGKEKVARQQETTGVTGGRGEKKKKAKRSERERRGEEGSSISKLLF